MLPTTIRSPPSLNDYIPLSEYQSQTPETFHGGKPVLHYHATGAKAWIPKAQQSSGLIIFPADLPPSRPTGPESVVLNGSSEDLLEQKIDLFVNSESLTLFCPATESGVSIPYPSITLHATKQIGGADAAAATSSGEQEERRYMSLYMQLQLSDGGGDDESFEIVELTIVPPESSTDLTGDEQQQQAATEADKLFKAISECSNLHPDPADEDDDENDGYYAAGADDRIIFEGGADGGQPEAIEGYSGVFSIGGGGGRLPPPMPGSSGWITAENVHEYFDEEGNWIGGEGVSGELGEGAGRVRVRNEAERDAEANGKNGEEDSSESKRPRTE
ncbi:Benzoylformate decarboxylase [Pleurostoma richardsiae]|uniref:Benzoylformate decarboxylase n=1 Tax=Pleurostoma richardsiae TaxID=41990 RepID=A0AA38RCF4_9PEZI|nr:Benzoylformate decarboxylase [Pleurostoma richardsiae]